jgi:oligo-1,6-glucosidase
VVAVGNFGMLLEQDPRVYAFTRSLDDVTLLVLGNFSADEVPVGLPGAAEWAESDLLIGNYPASDGPAPGIVLRPWETRVYRRG